MLERLKRGLVESFIEAIALGWVFAQGIFHFTYVFSGPVERWLMRTYNGDLTHDPTTAKSLLFHNALPQLVSSVLLLLVGYLLLRWLYFKPSAD